MQINVFHDVKDVEVFELIQNILRMKHFSSNKKIHSYIKGYIKAKIVF